MSRRSRVVLVALLATLVVVGLRVALDPDDGPDSAPSPASPTSPAPTEEPPVVLADLDTTTLGIARRAFCDALPAATLERALGAPARASRAYGDGESALVAGGVRDIAHEFACAWTAGDVTARAWVFAPPVTRAGARDLAAAATATRGCRPLPDAVTYGSPSVGLSCTTDRGTEVSYRGLFGDAWLVCSLTSRTPRADLAGLTRRADEWCAGVVQAAAVKFGQ